MLSSQLSSLSQQIEAQTTDHFGKFYMYVGLLNSITERKKTFTKNLQPILIIQITDLE